MLRAEVASFLLLLALVVAPSLCDSANVRVTLPDDSDFKKYNFVYMTIDGVQTIDSVNSSLEPNKFDVDKSANPHRIVFKADLSSTNYQLDVASSSSATPHKLLLTLDWLSPTEIYKAVFLSGPSTSVSSLANRSDVRLLSRAQLNGTHAEAAVLVAKAGATRDFLPLWEAYDWLWNETQSGGTGIQLLPDRCPAAAPPAELCRSRLAFSTGRPSARAAVVQLNSADNFLGFSLSWRPQTAAQMLAEACGPATCLNGGRCDTTYTGAGFRCICPTTPNTPWGPRCEAPIRSYHGHEDQPAAFTRHWIGDLPHSPDSLKLSFEFAGTMQLLSTETFALKSSNNLMQSLVAISLIRGMDKMEINGSLLGGHAIKLGAEQLNGGSWFSLRILLSRLSTKVVLCPKNLPTVSGNPSLECHKKENVTNNAADFLNDFGNYWLEIGRGLQGCVQSVALNGFTVDLQAARGVNVDVSTLETSCSRQKSTCGNSSPLKSTSYACGSESVCYGVIKTTDNSPMDCNCKCLGSKRKVLETVTKSDACRADSITSNRCEKEPLVLNTVSASNNNWTLNSSLHLPLPLKTAASFEMELRTRNRAVNGTLRSIIRSTGRSQIMTQRLDISDGALRLCIQASGCWQFPPIRVDDGEWHSLSAAIEKNFLRLAVDGVSSMYDGRNSNSNFESMELSVTIANSSLRNIRVSGIYMSTNASDVSMEESTGAYVVLIPASDTTVNGGSINRAPSCESFTCPSNERCVRLWGSTTCECQAGLERNSEGTCAVPNPCVKYSITCPSKGQCQLDEAEPGFKCICPEDVTSRLCEPSSVSTPAPAMAGIQWWIWLIVGIIAFAMLVGLVFLLLLLRRSRPKAANGGGLEIEKVQQGMGVDSENEGVPPEDYPNTESLRFPPTKDSNGALPNFQPVAIASSPGTIAGRPVASEPLRAATAPAPTTPDSDVDGADDGAAGDETLNYGYEDTRDDDAADLDEISIVSADTDFSFDLKPTLDEWGPKFQHLSDILT